VSERWVPLLAAVVGLLGGMGGAYIGGSVANEGQQQRFESEQAAESRDLRRDADADFLEACEALNFGGTSTTPAARVGELFAAEARVTLVTSSSEVRAAALKLLNACHSGLLSEDPAKYQAVRDSFIDAAQREVTSGG
jgi:CHASE1-domain containing sensor protein